MVSRLAERDPRGERTQWRTCSQITTYACARAMAEIAVEGNTIRLDLPVQTPDLTLRLTDGEVRSVRVDGRPLTRAASRAAFKSDTFLLEDEAALVAFAPSQRRVLVEVEQPT